MDQSLDKYIASNKKLNKISYEKTYRANTGAKQRENANALKIRPKRKFAANVGKSNGDARAKILNSKRVVDARTQIKQKIVNKTGDLRSILPKKKPVDLRTKIHSNTSAVARRRSVTNARPLQSMKRRHLEPGIRVEQNIYSYDEIDDLRPKHASVKVRGDNLVVTKRRNDVEVQPTGIPRSMRLHRGGTGDNVLVYADSDTRPTQRPTYQSRRDVSASTVPPRLLARPDSIVNASRPVTGNAMEVSSAHMDQHQPGPVYQQALAAVLASTRQVQPTNFEDGYKLSVANLSRQVTEEDVVELFSDVGTLRKAKLIRPGYAEVTYVTKTDANRAITKYNRRELDGIPMSITLIQEPSNPMRAIPEKRSDLASAVRDALFSRSGPNRPTNFTIKL